MPLTAQAQSPIQESSWVQGKEYRLKMEVFQKDTTTKHPVLVIALHGDSPFQNHGYQNVFAAEVTAKTQNIVAIAPVILIPKEIPRKAGEAKQMVITLQR